MKSSRHLPTTRSPSSTTSTPSKAPLTRCSQELQMTSSPFPSRLAFSTTWSRCAPDPRYTTFEINVSKCAGVCLTVVAADFQHVRGEEGASYDAPFYFYGYIDNDLGLQVGKNGDENGTGLHHHFNFVDTRGDIVTARTCATCTLWQPHTICNTCLKRAGDRSCT